MTLSLLDQAKADYKAHAQADPTTDKYVQVPNKKNGFFIVRLLPAATNFPAYVTTRIHRLNGQWIHCPRERNNGKWRGPCPICQFMEKEDLYNTNKDEWSKLKTFQRTYYNAVVRSMTNLQGETVTNVGPKVLSVGMQLQQVIVDAIVGNETKGEASLGDVSDLKHGRDLKIVITMNGDNPRYDASKFLDPTPAGTKAQVDEWMASLHDLPAERKVLSIDEIQKLLDEYRSGDLSTAAAESVAKADDTDLDTSFVENDFVASLRRSR